MNSKVAYALLLALTLLIVLPVLSTVNATPAQHASGSSVVVADGSPGPPPTPNPWLVPQQEPLLVADGSPGPPANPESLAGSAARTDVGCGRIARSAANSESLAAARIRTRRRLDIRSWRDAESRVPFRLKVERSASPKPYQVSLFIP